MHALGLQYAGNVVVYGPASPCDGDWYGGLRAADARPFLAALLAMPLDAVGGPADALLARHWRGRMGLAKDDQVPCQSCCTCLAWPAWRHGPMLGLPMLCKPSLSFASDLNLGFAGWSCIRWCGWLQGST